MSITTNFVNKEIYKNYETAKTCSNNNCAAKNTSFEKKEEKKDKLNLPVLSISALATFASLLFIRKYQGKSLKNNLEKISKSNDIKTNLIALKNKISSFLDIETELKEFLILGGSSILGGITGGIISDKNQNTNNKIKEGIYQFGNIAIPASIVTGLAKLVEKAKIKNAFSSKAAKIMAVIVGIGGGMPLSSKICNKINNFYDGNKQHYNRSIKLKDGLMHIDDVSWALILADPRLAGKLCINKILPLLFLTSGYEAGTKK